MAAPVNVAPIPAQRESSWLLRWMASVGVVRGVLQTLDQIEIGIARGVAFADQHLARLNRQPCDSQRRRQCAAHAVRDDEDESFVAQIEAGQVFGWGIAIGAGPGLFGRQIEYEEIIFIATSNSANV